MVLTQFPYPFRGSMPCRIILRLIPIDPENGAMALIVLSLLNRSDIRREQS